MSRPGNPLVTCGRYLNKFRLRFSFPRFDTSGEISPRGIVNGSLLVNEIHVGTLIVARHNRVTNSMVVYTHHHLRIKSLLQGPSSSTFPGRGRDDSGLEYKISSTLTGR